MDNRVPRTIITLAAVWLACSAPAAAQAVELTPFAGYVFGGSISVREGDADIKSGAAFGAVAAVPLRYGVDLELLYLRQATSLEFQERGSGDVLPLFDMTVNYFQAGAVYEVQEGWSVPFFGAGLGAVSYVPDRDELDSELRFAFNIAGGAKLYLGDHVGLRLEGRLLFPLQWSGGTFFCDGSDCGNTTASTTSLVQVALSAGLLIRIGDPRPGIR